MKQINKRPCEHGNFAAGGAAALSIVICALMLGACSGGQQAVSTVMSSNDTATSASASLLGQMSVTISNSSGTTVYSDANSSSGLNLVAGQTYQLDLTATGFPAGTTFSLVSQETSVVSGSDTTLALSPGVNSLTIPAQGDYSWQLVASSPGYNSDTKYYQADVTCADPTFTQASLNPAAIQVTAGSQTNLYNFSSSGVTANANGMAPYLCAWDPTGTGIADTGFQDCSQVLSNFYVNYVGQRNVGLLVKDACNTTYAISNSVDLSYTEPAMPGNVFIYGQISNATGIAASDSRVNNVTYLATNANGYNIVQPLYSSGTFQITSSADYGMSSSVPFGMQITVNGIQDSINVSNGTGTISAANARISAVTYSTDEAGDQTPAATYQSTSCTLSNPGARVVYTQGQPCSEGTSGDNNSATVEVWGHYQCSLSNGSGATATIAGDFDGYTSMVDNCVGGGGGGSGGIVPIQL